MVRERVPRVHQRGSLYPIIDIERKILKKESNEISTYKSSKNISNTNSITKISLEPLTPSNEYTKEESPITPPQELIEELPLTPQSESMEEIQQEKKSKRREQPNIILPASSEETRRRRKTSNAATLPYEQLLSFDGANESQRIEGLGRIEEPNVETTVEQSHYTAPFPPFEFEYRQEHPLPIQTSFIEPIQYQERTPIFTYSNEVESPKSPLKHGDVFLTDWPRDPYELVGSF